MTKVLKTILCIDDDRDDQFLIRESIRRLSDINIESAYDGKEALAILQQRKLSNHLPSLIVTDINMPKMDGNSMLKKIREDNAFRGIPIVVFKTSTIAVNQPYLDMEQIETLDKPTDWASYEGIAKKILSLVDPT